MPQKLINPQSDLLLLVGDWKVRYLDDIKWQIIHTKFQKNIYFVQECLWSQKPTICLLNCRLKVSVDFIFVKPRQVSWKSVRWLIGY